MMGVRRHLNKRDAFLLSVSVIEYPMLLRSLDSCVAVNEAMKAPRLIVHCTSRGGADGFVGEVEYRQSFPTIWIPPIDGVNDDDLLPDASPSLVVSQFEQYGSIVTKPSVSESRWRCRNRTVPVTPQLSQRVNE